jgi:hypothetical protein
MAGGLRRIENSLVRHRRLLIDNEPATFSAWLRVLRRFIGGGTTGREETLFSFPVQQNGLHLHL